MEKQEKLQTALNDLFEITKVVILYTNGAPADSCMERITNIIAGED
ncbi:MAG: hypothetical protein K6C94_07785 [Candidatus Gastranaerophilales bacterium]|nr:hypothetical protein [Candidatus Gastranaerophilales bacterium]